MILSKSTGIFCLRDVQKGYAVAKETASKGLHSYSVPFYRDGSHTRTPNRYLKTDHEYEKDYDYE
jgi:hypothetical protein